MGRAIQPVERFHFGAVCIAGGQVRTAISPKRLEAPLASLSLQGKLPGSASGQPLAVCDVFSSRIEQRSSSASERNLKKLEKDLKKGEKREMIAEPTDMLDQCCGRTGRLVADNVYASASPIAKAAFVYTPAIPFEIKPHAPKIGFVPPKGVFGRRSNGRITRKPLRKSRRKRFSS